MRGCLRHAGCRGRRGESNVKPRFLATPHISSLPISSISTRQRGPCAAKLFIRRREDGGVHAPSTRVFASVSNAKEQASGGDDIQAQTVARRPQRGEGGSDEGPRARPQRLRAHTHPRLEARAKGSRPRLQHLLVNKYSDEALAGSQAGGR